MEDKKQLLVRAVVIGQSNIGKTSLILREVNNTYSDKFVATIGIDFWVKKYFINDEHIKGQLWDSSSFERRLLMRSSIPSFYKKVNIFGLCFDLNDRTTIDLIKQLTKTIRTGNQLASCFLIGCKSDLEHKISEVEIAKYCQLDDLVYLQTSSKENKGVNQAFLKMMETGQTNLHKQKVEENISVPSKYSLSFCKS